MREIAVAALLLGMTSCASVAEVSQDQPYATYSSTKPPKELAQCIRNAWQNTKFRGTANAADLQEDGTIYRVLSPSGPTPNDIAVITPGQVSIHFRATTLGARKSNRVNAARSCL
jgi:hypothetical protein